MLEPLSKLLYIIYYLIIVFMRASFSFIVVTRMQDVNSVGITISFSIEPLQAKPEMINDLPFQVQQKKQCKEEQRTTINGIKIEF